MPAFSAAKEEFSRISWLQLLVYMEFVVAAVIVIFTIIGLAIGQPVAMLFLLAFLQFLIALPGCIYSTQRVGLFHIAYLGAQIATGICEVTWFVVHLAGGGSWPAALALGILAVVQAVSVILALTCGEMPVVRKKKKRPEVQLKFETTTTSAKPSDVESQKAIRSLASKTSNRSSKKSKKTMKVKKRDETMTNKSGKSQQCQENSSRIESLSATQPTHTALSPTSKNVPTFQAGEKRLAEIKKYLANYDDKEKNRSTTSLRNIP